MNLALSSFVRLFDVRRSTIDDRRSMFDDFSNSRSPPLQPIKKRKFSPGAPGINADTKKKAKKICGKKMTVLRFDHPRNRSIFLPEMFLPWVISLFVFYLRRSANRGRA